eukprot:gene7601-biopygen13597
MGDLSIHAFKSVVTPREQWKVGETPHGLIGHCPHSLPPLCARPVVLARCTAATWRRSRTATAARGGQLSPRYPY